MASTGQDYSDIFPPNNWIFCLPALGVKQDGEFERIYLKWDKIPKHGQQWKYWHHFFSQVFGVTTGKKCIFFSKMHLLEKDSFEKDTSLILLSHPD